MHHPDICNIVLTIDDYFMLVDDNSKCEIEGYVEELDEDESQYVVTIKRKLSKGWIKVSAIGVEEDDNTLEVNYVSDSQPGKLIQSIRIEDDDYSTETVRGAIRRVLKQDKNAVTNN